MKVLLDTCVIYPTVMREVLLRVAAAGVFEPLWSARILEEWARAAIKLGPTGEMQARSEGAMMTVKWPKASVVSKPSLAARLWLPDGNDVHVLAAAIAGSADMIITLNAKDFPRNILTEEGLVRQDPDGFLHGVWQAQPELLVRIVGEVRDEAERLSGKAWEMRALMKKARLPRLGKAVARR